MSYFPRQQAHLYAEALPLADIARQFGTPTYVYSRAALTDAYNQYATALGDHDGLVCFAVKANSNLGVLGLLADLGAGFDIVSEGELERVLLAGGKPERIVFSGVGKTATAIRKALEVGVHCFNVESEAELELLADIAKQLDTKAPISLRVNPDVDAQTHPYISTGLKENKFGIDIQRAPQVYKRAAALGSLNIVGVDCHIGSQLTQLTPFIDALDRLLALIDTLKADGIVLKHIDIGGGLGVTYRDETPPPIGSLIAQVKEKLQGRNLALVMEPGRSICANAGVLLAEVLFLKPTEHKNFAIIDAAMNDNIRPALYQAWQDVQPVELKTTEAKTWDLVGPVCETGDFLAKDRTLALAAGDLIAVMSTGAYGFTMSSNYNSRTRAAEVIVDGNRAYLVRERETLADLTRGESLLP
ncbi:diaminopimelate decarboxylase [Simiduia curdlanivorans]|uniref:Diaminopimelate decarboxylase n=1 Tax=Simiduia curdlanivorans TaxID=1492769 RepID=A0ABV8UZB1_9GAMM|nr:diaminopimelate decarboxylase [Simiduia curdlanivorans]MDN3638126.1 diaminopimelate decarboxylase [Simiduia curdlanivorans]